MRYFANRHRGNFKQFMEITLALGQNMCCRTVSATPTPKFGSMCESCCVVEQQTGSSLLRPSGLLGSRLVVTCSLFWSQGGFSCRPSCWGEGAESQCATPHSNRTVLPHKLTPDLENETNSNKKAGSLLAHPSAHHMVRKNKVKKKKV